MQKQFNRNNKKKKKDYIEQLHEYSNALSDQHLLKYSNKCLNTHSNGLFKKGFE